jgi:cobalamin biosynthesis protein CobT
MEIPETKPQEGEGEGEGEGQEGEGEGEGQEGEGEGEGEGQEGQGEGEGQEGQGEGEGEGEGENESEGKGKAKGEGKKPGRSQPTGKSGKTIQELMKEIGESKPWSSTASLSEYSEVPKFVPFDKKQIKEGSAYRFTEAEKKDSEMLIKLLDISFDPKSDDVKNLRIGKLDTAKIAEIPAGNMSVYKQTVEEQDTKPFSVCILADMSGSMSQGNRIPAQHHILNTLYLAMSQILPPDKLYIYGHSGNDFPEIYTFYSPYDTEYEKNIRFYQQVNWFQNYDGPVIEAIHKKVRETNDDRIIFISLSDGQPCGNGYGGEAHNEELKRILERARRDEFVTVGIGIEADHVGQLYTYSKVVNDLRLLPKEVSSIVNQVVRVEFQ